MPFRKFSIPKRPSEDGRCLARMRDRSGTEGYCQQPGVDGGRCPTHRTEHLVRARKEQARQRAVSDTDRIQERYQELCQDPNNLAELDDEILQLAAVIDVLEENPLAHLDTIRRLKETKASLVETLVRVEPQACRIILAFTKRFWSKVQDVLEEYISDRATCLAAQREMEQFLQYQTVKWSSVESRLKQARSNQ